jgi:hypothetical protein
VEWLPVASYLSKSHENLSVGSEVKGNRHMDDDDTVSKCFFIKYSNLLKAVFSADYCSQMVSTSASICSVSSFDHDSQTSHPGGFLATLPLQDTTT